MIERPGYLWIEEAAAHYAVPVSTIWGWITTDQLPSYKFPRDRRTYVRLDEFRARLAIVPRTGRPARWRSLAVAGGQS